MERKAEPLLCKKHGKAWASHSCGIESSAKSRAMADSRAGHQNGSSSGAGREPGGFWGRWDLLSLLRKGACHTCRPSMARSLEHTHTAVALHKKCPCAGSGLQTGFGKKDPTR